MMKYIHMRDMIKLWEKFLTKFKHIIILDKEKGYIYLRSFLWYTDAKLSKQKQPELVEVLNKHLLPQDKDIIMKTIADTYREEGREEGVAQGIEIGDHNRAVIVAKEMFTEGFKISLIAKITHREENFIRSIVKK
ncbi:transposase [Rickettsia sp. TH2014]|uniref:transposase n=1 Tax=Rickettsia sp. TH2014 TaxID=1967503 RepID=UPI002113A355|nr:transposase [Rickettsia sp. TH2014]